MQHVEDKAGAEGSGAAVVGEGGGGGDTAGGGDAPTSEITVGVAISCEGVCPSASWMASTVLARRYVAGVDISM